MRLSSGQSLADAFTAATPLFSFLWEENANESHLSHHLCEGYHYGILHLIFSVTGLEPTIMELSGGPFYSALERPLNPRRIRYGCGLNLNMSEEKALV